MLTILYDPAGLAGSERHRWDFAVSIQANIERHLTSGAGCKVRLNGQEVDPVAHPAMDRLPTVADYVTVVRRPEGFDPFTWALIAVAAIAAASYVLLQRPNVGSMATGKDSPNNKLTAQSNVARAYQAIPDVYGYRRVWPDMIQPSTVEYIDHIKYVTEWLCVSRGRGDVSSVQYAETPIGDIAGASYEIFQPVSTGGYPETGNTTLYDVIETFESPEVNGQEIQYASPWPVVSGANGVVNATTTSATFTLRVPDSPSLDQLKSIAGTGSVQATLFNNFGEDGKYFSGICLIVGFALDSGNCTFTLTSESGVFTDDWPELVATYDLDPQRISYNPIGPFTLPVDGDRIRWNTVFLRGLKYSIAIRAEWWKVDGSGAEIGGTRQSQDFAYSANTYDPRFYTNEVIPAAGRGRYRVQFTRLTPQQGDQGTDLAKLEELYAVRHYGEKVLPGVTVIRLTTKATTEATGYSDRKFNLRWQRHVRGIFQTGGRYQIGASRNFGRAIAHMWDLARNSMDELDLDALQAINNEHGEDSPLLRFDASLDDADMSLGERMQLAADTARGVIWRDGRKWTCVRDQAKDYPELQLDYRNLAAGGESSITESAHLPASYDGIELEYVNETDQSKKSYIRISIASGAPVYGVSANPKKVQLTCCTTYSQADNRAQLEARKLIYQRTSVSDTALADASDLGLGALVRWIDPNDFGGDDGLQAGEVMAISGNLIATSEPVNWQGETQGRILITGANGRHLGAPIVCYPVGELIELASVPAGLYVADGIDSQLGSRYTFAVGLTDAELESAGLYTVTSNKPDSGGNRALALVAYDARVYGADT